MKEAFTGFSPCTVDFLMGIRHNNEKAWFEEHKDAYLQDLLAPMNALGHAVFARMQTEYAKQGFVLKFTRIYRDARRLHGRGMYKDNLWFTIARPSEDMSATPVLWFELTPDEWSYGLGYYMAKPATMAKLRARMDKDPKAFERLIAPLAKQTEFVLEGPEYTRKKEAPTPGVAEWYNRKSFALGHTQAHGEEIFRENLVDRLVEGYGFLMVYYDYFAAVDRDLEVGV